MTTPARPRAVLDTDTYNEVDDQFALAHLLLSPDQVDLEAVYAAPFFNDRSTGPADGMEKSYEEIHRVLELVKTPNPPAVKRGSTRYLPDATTPVESEMVADLIDRAMNGGPDRLHVLAIGAITNVASALLAEPRIADRISITWLGGHAPYWPHTREFNLEQDLHASRVVLNSSAPLVLIPCMPVASHLLVTVAELEKHLEPFSKLGAFLTETVRNYHNLNNPGRAKQIWDIAVSGWMIDPEWAQTESRPSPVLRDDVTWENPTPAGRHRIQISRELWRDAIFEDFYRKAAASAGTV